MGVNVSLHSKLLEEFINKCAGQCLCTCPIVVTVGWKTVLFFRLKIENWYSQSHSVLPYLSVILLCGTCQVLWLELPKYKACRVLFFFFCCWVGWLKKWIGKKSRKVIAKNLNSSTPREGCENRASMLVTLSLSLPSLVAQRHF